MEVMYSTTIYRQSSNHTKAKLLLNISSWGNNSILSFSPFIICKNDKHLVTLNTPDKAITKINNIIQNFMWDDLTSKISQQTLIQGIEDGGLKLCHFPTKVKSIKLA